MEYRLKKVNISSISNNKHLGVSIQEHDIDRCLKTMRNYGLLTPVVVGRIDEKQEIVLSGQCEINAMRQMKIRETDVILVDCKDNLEANKLSLLISTLHNQPSAIAEGLIIKDILETNNLKQKNIAYLLGKSESWVAKRLSLVQRLTQPVIDMVINKNIYSRTAEEISRLPPEVQTNFAHKVAELNLSKSKVEQLIIMYNNPSIGQNVKNGILENPGNCANILIKKIVKEPSKTLENDDNRKISLIKTSISIIIRVICDIESNIHQIPIIKIQEQKKLLANCLLSVERFSKVLSGITRENFPGERTPNDVNDVNGGEIA